MKAIEKRVAALEVDHGLGNGQDWRAPTHVVLCEEEQSYVDALIHYSKEHPDKVLSPEHNVFWIMLTEPKFDDEGNRIFLRGAKPASKAPSLRTIISETENVE